jgi:hypothetical protein
MELDGRFWRYVMRWFLVEAIVMVSLTTGLCHAPGAEAESTGRRSLAAGELEMTLDATLGGGSSLRHGPSGTELISGGGGGLFALELTRPAKAKRMHLHAGQFARRRLLPVAEGNGCDMEFSDSSQKGLSVTCSIRTDRGGALRFRIAVQNETPWAVRQVVYPILDCTTALGGDAKDDRMLVPAHGGVEIAAPGRKSWGPLRATHPALPGNSLDYPGRCFAQFLAYYDPRVGLYFASEDSRGRPKYWHLSRRGKKRERFRIGLGHFFPETPGNDAALDYDVVLRGFVGDWRTAADIYREWAVTQPWCARRLADRRDVASFLKDGAGILLVHDANNAATHGKLLGRNLEKLPAFAAAYRQRTGLKHMVVVPYGWENRGKWAGINYFPALPSNEAWRKAAAALKKQGDRVAFLTSGFWWVIKRKETRAGPAFDDSADFETRKAMVAAKPDGSPWFVDCYNRTQTGSVWRGLSAVLCHGSPQARRTVKEFFLEAVRCGATLVSFDQEIGGRQVFPCYDAKHGHPPGYGRYMWDGFRRTCDEILEEGRKINPELGLFMECDSELAIPHMATYWSRQFGEVIDRANVQGRCVGLFSYLYHDYVTMIGAACVQGQGELPDPPGATLRCRVFANNLRRGLIPGPIVQDVPLEPDSDWHRTVARAHFNYCRPYPVFARYLLLGRAVRPPKCTAPSVKTWYWKRSKGGTQNSRGIPVRKQEIQVPAVDVGSFRADDGSVGTVVVNITEEPRRAQLELVRPARSAVLFDAQGKELQQWKRRARGGTLEIEVPPLEVVVLITRP